MDTICGDHHYIGLNSSESRGGSPAPPGSTGLFHVAVRHPDGNGIELYWDGPRNFWPHDDKGNLSMFTKPLGLSALLSGL